MTDTPAQRLARLAHTTAATGLPREFRDEMARRVLDMIGNSLAAVPTDIAASVSAMAGSWGGTPQATAIGADLRLPAHAAALVNGTLAHSLDFDDTHLPSVLHPSAAVLPAALAAAETAGAPGAAFLDAAAVGIEVTCRLGMAGYEAAENNSIFFDRGLHATSICGTVGAAVSAGMLYGLGEAELTSAIGIACSMGSGIIEANRTGGTVKRVHCGWAAHAGVVAADLAGHGMTGPATALEGRFGFLTAFCGDRADANRITDDLGRRWEVRRLFVKPYPCNHFTHAGIDAALRLRAKGVVPESITALTLGVPAPVVHTIGEPREAKIAPISGYHGAFSGPFTVAAALLGGGGLGVSHADFTDSAVRAADRLALARKVRVIADAECTSIFPHQFPAVLTAELADGSSYVERVRANRGGPDNPLTPAELVTKFRANARRTLTSGQADHVAELTTELPTAPDIGTLTAILRGRKT
ncbi:MmgE/PrpD family protein [Nocardia sp. NEAU-G5]|uniref:MmgE/PrpD family protein n=1 Tax=Nocardia albiluteola TaxID=2842303 RepID=A0ABS6BCU6_9NOCA|nr:MmgE/PrpD family protein [Nocardia albiluteola]MBU3068117.1 MmgE/PrpD family protein [Nocardia albiluteola]